MTSAVKVTVKDIVTNTVMDTNHRGIQSWTQIKTNSHRLHGHKSSIVTYTVKAIVKDIVTYTVVDTYPL